MPKRGAGTTGAAEWMPRTSRGVPVNSLVNCADNSGAKVLRVIQVIGYRGRLRRRPAATVGDKLAVVVRKGPPEMKKQIFYAVLVRQRYPFRRPSGVRVSFEDNAAVLITPEGDVKGTDIHGPVAAEAAERWPRIANIASIII
ncbi:MAG: 50S ribosomal protein L14 [Nitrososphaeria archaeon]|jgi:large subunit ribosomal protein L14|nr:50S ribosomal protein L14 [Nitrososphaerota archaeon]